MTMKRGFARVPARLFRVSRGRGGGLVGALWAGQPAGLGWACAGSDVTEGLRASCDVTFKNLVIHCICWRALTFICM
jgi:hypothetical protein